jgi:hypothetical protein
MPVGVPTGEAGGPSTFERAGVLRRVKGSRAKLGGFAALDPPCALQRETDVATGGRMPPAGLGTPDRSP